MAYALIRRGDFFRNSPAPNPARRLIKGSICGIRGTDFEEFDDDMEDIDASANDKKDDNDDSLLYSIYIFDSLSQIIDVSRLIAPTFKGDSSVYKSPFNDKYYLSLCVEASQGKKLNRIYSILTEHGVRENPTYAKELFYMEHFDEILANKAIETLGAL